MKEKELRLRLIELATRLNKVSLMLDAYQQGNMPFEQLEDLIKATLLGFTFDYQEFYGMLIDYLRHLQAKQSLQNEGENEDQEGESCAL